MQRESKIPANCSNQQARWLLWLAEEFPSTKPTGQRFPEGTQEKKRPNDYTILV